MPPELIFALALSIINFLWLVAIYFWLKKHRVYHLKLGPAICDLESAVWDGATVNNPNRVCNTGGGDPPDGYGEGPVPPGF